VPRPGVRTLPLGTGRSHPDLMLPTIRRSMTYDVHLRHSSSKTSLIPPALP
jgi:hypothetical protein